MLRCSHLQVRWVQFRRCWVTAADDDMIRIWGSDGTKLHQFAYQVRAWALDLP